MASALIQERGTVSGNQMRMRRLGELAGQTFLQGTPLMIDSASGYLKAWDGTTVSNGIAGISKEFGANLSTNATAQDIGFGSVPNESGAQNKTRPYFNDGKTGIVLAIPDTLFYGQVGPAQTTAATDVGKQYGMTKDSDNHWFVDKTKSTVGTNTVVMVVALDYWDTTRGVLFTFVSAASQLLA